MYVRPFGYCLRNTETLLVERILGHSRNRNRSCLLYSWGGHRWSIYLNQNRREIRYAGSLDPMHRIGLTYFFSLSVTFAGAALFILFGFIYTYQFFVDISGTPSP